MVGSSSSFGLQHHGRSISLPSRLHPHSTKIEAEINKFKFWETSMSSNNAPLSSESIQIGLVGLAELYNCVEELILSPLVQQSLCQPQNGELVIEEALEGSIVLLDLCGVSRDIFSIMKQHVLDLQSVLRRKGGDSSIESNINAYMCLKKKVIKKDVSKCLRKLKQMENKFGSSCNFLDIDHGHLSMVIRVLREIESIAISVIRSILLFLSTPFSKTKPCGWSLISRLMLTRSQVACETGYKVFNEVGSVDLALHSLHGCIKSSDTKIDVQIARRRLETLDDTIVNLENGLDCLYRSLIRHRVSLLNILV